MTFTFHKYHGAGNDFIIIDDRSERFLKNIRDPKKFISRLCQRRFGIGADGLMFIRESNAFDFDMVYYNRDGLEGSLCGNGGRCIAAFAAGIGLIKDRAVFGASDGPHTVLIKHHEENTWDISLQMSDVRTIRGNDREFVLDTGSPHLVVFSEDVLNKDVVAEGRELRYSPAFSDEGINVNFAEILDHSTILMRTYERGVEDETLACGTGATAVALAAWQAGFRNPENNYTLKAPGGDLTVSFHPPMEAGATFRNIWLSGPAEKVFSGQVKP